MKKTIGIWGFGIVGKAALRFLASEPAKPVLARFGIAGHGDIVVCDAAAIDTSRQKLIEQHGARLLPTSTPIETFLNTCDIVIPSPGIDLRPHCAYKHKFVSELDLFSVGYNNTTIAITGTLGKTTVTTQLGQVLSHYASSQQVATAGNVGTGMLEVLCNQPHPDTCVLELSSFQLEHSTHFAPNLAIWTNFFPNHLDRHEKLEDYFTAKWQLLCHQRPGQPALVGLDIALSNFFSKRAKTLASTLSVVSERAVSPAERAALAPYVQHIYQPDSYGHFLLKDNTAVCSLGDLPAIGFIANWLTLAAALDLLGLKVERKVLDAAAQPQQHRLALVHTTRGINFYNDSKATVPQATIAAIRALAKKRRSIILILGGTSKGADRTALRASVHNEPQIKEVFCFGAERATFGMGKQYKTLEKVVDAVMRIAVPGDSVLFSPSGASFDLFENYKARGARFVELVRMIQ